MKRIIIISVLLAMSFFSHAQELNSADTAVDCSLPGTFKLQLGIQGGLMRPVMSAASPYCSKYGILLELPLQLSYQASSHWSLSTGLLYRFQWMPLYHTVTSVEDGLTFDQTAQVGKQHGYIYRNYIGIPLKATWYPKADNHGALSLSFDCYAAYGIAEFYHLDRVEGHYNSSGGLGATSTSSVYSNQSSRPWKLELGVTLSTDVLGFIHGIRLFGNLLPEYKDPTTGDLIRTFGLTFYL